MRISGTVKFYNASKGYGFIAPEAARRTSLSMRALSSGLVSFRSMKAALEDDRKGRGKQAGDIQKQR